MAKTKEATYRNKRAFATMVNDVPRVVKKHTQFADGHEIMRGREQLFEPVPEGPNFDIDSSSLPGVEQPAEPPTPSAPLEPPTSSVEPPAAQAEEQNTADDAPEIVQATPEAEASSEADSGDSGDGDDDGSGDSGDESTGPKKPEDTGGKASTRRGRGKRPGSGLTTGDTPGASS